MMKRYCLLLATLCLGLLSCREESRDVPDEVRFDGLEAYTFGYEGEEVLTFAVTSNKPWSVVAPDADWLTVSRTGGPAGGPSEVTVTADPNEGERRSGVLTIYAGAQKRSVTLVQAARPVPPTLTVEGLEDLTLSFAAASTSSVYFTVTANTEWTALVEGLDWARVSPRTGDAGSTAITVVPTINTGSAREGTITFRAEGETLAIVTVRQEAYVEIPYLTVAGIGGGTLIFPFRPDAPVNLSVLSNRAWKVSKSGLDWLEVSPDAGEGSDGEQPVTLTAGSWTGAEPRTGTLTFISENDGVADVVITVVQEARPADVLLAAWPIPGNAASQAAWVTSSTENPSESGSVGAEKGLPGAAMSFRIATENKGLAYNTADNTPVGAGDGTYALRTVFTGDGLVITIPDAGLKPGDHIAIRFGIRTTQYNIFWNVQYLDGGEWKNTSQHEYTSTGGAAVTATLKIEKANSILSVDESAYLSDAYEGGTLTLRIVAADARYNTRNDTNTVPRGTIKFTPGASEDGIYVWKLGE